MFLTNKTSWLDSILLLGLRKLQQFLGRSDLCLPAGGAGRSPHEVTNQLPEGLQVVFIGEAVDDGVDEGRGPGEDVGDHVEPAQLWGRDGVEDGKDCPGEETDQECEVDQGKRQGQTAFSFFGLNGDAVRSIKFQWTRSIFSSFSCIFSWKKYFDKTVQ